MLNRTTFEDPFPEEIWNTTYKDAADTDVDAMMWRVARGIAAGEKNKDLRERWAMEFYNILAGFVTTAGGRIYANAGTDWKGTTLMNCFAGPRVKYDVDSLDGILSHLISQAQTLKSEGGWGDNFSYIRPRGSFIHGIGVESPGAVKYMELFDRSSDIITQGSGTESTNKKAKGKIRKGAMMGVMSVWHPDIMEFITAKQSSGRLSKFNMSVDCTDEFMTKVIRVKELDELIAAVSDDDDTTQSLQHLRDEADKWDLRFPVTTHEAYKSEWDGGIKTWESKGYPVKVFRTISVMDLWNLIIESTYKRAEPGVLFLDRANYFNPLNYLETIFTTNPCLHPDSMVETVEGRVRIADIKDETQVYTMEEDGSLGVSKCSAAFKTKENAQTLTITIGSGKAVTCTPDHRIYVVNRGWVEAQDIKVGDRLVQLCRARRGVAYSGVKLSTEDNRAYQMEHRLVANAVYGLDDGDDVHHIDGDTYNNSIDNLEVMQHSDHSTLTRYECDNNHQVKDGSGKFISNDSGYEKVIIPMPNHLKSNMKNGNSSCVVSIASGETTDVYDITVEGTHNFISDFIVVHNCGEQVLAPAGVCDLGSINLTQFVMEVGGVWYFDFKKLVSVVPTMVRFLDDVNEVSDASLPEYIDSMRNKRRIGIGVLGWGSLLFMLKIRFGTIAAAALRDGIMQTIAVEAYKASIDLAIEKGMFKYCDPEKHAENPFIQSLELPEEYMQKLRTTGIRNSSLLSIQPTGNTSILANVVSGGLEPVFMFEYIRTIIVNHMPAHMKSYTPVWYEGEWYETDVFKFVKEGDEEILRGEVDGIVYKIDKNRGLTKEVLCEDYGVRWQKARGEWDENADWAVTTENLPVSAHLSDMTGFARWVDSAISKTINVPNDYPFEDFKDIYLDAYESGWIKGVTTYRAGTMTNVLSATDEKTADDSDEEIILDDVKLPNSAPAQLKTIRAEGKKWYLTVIYHEGTNRPFAMFVKTNAHEKTAPISNATELLLGLARTKGIPEKHVLKVEEKITGDNNPSKLTRVIGLLLRHGVLVKNICLTLDKVESAFVGSFVFQVKKFLQSHIKEGEVAEDTFCEVCWGDQVVYSEGCFKCLQCGSSKCG